MQNTLRGLQFEEGPYAKGNPMGYWTNSDARSSEIPVVLGHPFMHTSPSDAPDQQLQAKIILELPNSTIRRHCVKVMRDSALSRTPVTGSSSDKETDHVLIMLSCVPQVVVARGRRWGGHRYRALDEGAIHNLHHVDATYQSRVALGFMFCCGCIPPHVFARRMRIPVEGVCVSVLQQRRALPEPMAYPPPPRAQEPAMFDRGTRGWFLRTLFPLNLTAEPGVGSCAQPWATPYRGKKIFRRVAPGHACPLLSHT